MKEKKVRGQSWEEREKEKHIFCLCLMKYYFNELIKSGFWLGLTTAHWVPFFLSFSLSTILNIPLISFSLLYFFFSLSL